MQDSESGQLEKALRLGAGRIGFEAVVPNPKLKLLDQLREVMRLLLPAMPASHNPLFHPPGLLPMCQLPALYLLSLVPQEATRASSPKLSQNGTPGSWRKPRPVNDRRG